MSIVQNDSRELKISVQLSAISKDDIGQGSAQYAVNSQVTDPTNVRPLNNDNKVNNPEVLIGNLLNPIKDFRYGTKVNSIPSIQNAKISALSTHPSASSCTFAFGGIQSGSDSVSSIEHPVFNLLLGPLQSEYSLLNLYNSDKSVPNVVKTISNLTPPETKDILNNRSYIKAFIPFVAYNNYLNPTINNQYWSEQVLSFYKKRLTSYNIWNVYDPSNENTPYSKDVILYEGPQKIRNKTYIKTIRDGLNGARVFVDSKGKGKTGTIKRIFPTSKDAVFYDTDNPNKKVYDSTRLGFIESTGPVIFYPTRVRYKKSTINDSVLLASDTSSEVNTKSQDVFILPDFISAKGLDNCGFHINLSSLDVAANDSNITLVYENVNPKDNSIYYMSIVITPNSVPQILLKYKVNGEIKYKDYTQLKGPVFDGKATLGYDIFVHFTGPIILVGFTTDQSEWNAIYPEKLDDTKYIDCYFEKNKSFVKFTVTNCSFAFSYSTIIFDNYNLDLKFPTTNTTTNNIELLTSKKYQWQTVAYNVEWNAGLFSKLGVNPFLGGKIEYLNTKNHILIELQAPRNVEQTTLNKDSLLSSLIKNKFMSSLGPNAFNSLPSKDISIFGDWRNTYSTKTNPTPSDYLQDYLFHFIAKSFELPTISNGFTSYDNYVFKNRDITYTENKVKVWHKMFTNSTIEGPLWLSLQADTSTNLRDKDFLYPILDVNGKPLDLNNFVSGIEVTYGTQNDNNSLITRNATITLQNIDSSAIGWKILELLEHNILVITVKAGYDENNLYNYFEGVISDISTTRSGSSSETTLGCTDLGLYLLNNLYFDNIHSFATRTLKDSIQVIMDASGFTDYYHIEHENQIGFLDKRLSSNPTTPQDSPTLATPFDKIGDKLNLFLTKLVELERQGTFRWEPDAKLTELKKSGFVLDARYANYNCDDDLKFTGIDPVTNTIISVPNNPNSNSINDPGWHGLLTGSYTVSTNTGPFSYKVETFGYTNLEGVKFKDTNIVGSLRSVSEIQTALTNPVVPQGYVGFRKKVMDIIDRTKILDEEGITLKHNQNVLIVQRPFHQITFDCYITKPLKFHGTFIIKAFVDPNDINAYNVTDKYIYQSLRYTINKAENLITANVSGIRQPWTIRELKEENSGGI